MSEAFKVAAGQGVDGSDENRRAPSSTVIKHTTAAGERRYFVVWIEGLTRHASLASAAV